VFLLLLIWDEGEAKKKAITNVEFSGHILLIGYVRMSACSEFCILISF